MLTIRDLTGNEEMLADYKNMTRKRRVNGEHSLSFLIFRTERNAHSFDMIEDETILKYDGDEYRAKQIEQRLIGHTPVKQVHAEHVFFDIIDVYQYGKLIEGNTSISSALRHALADTGYTFSVIDPFPSQYFENFGDDNALSLLKTVLERYQAEYTLVGKDVRIYKQIGAETDFQFRYKHNIKTFAKTIKTDGLSTYIRGYGKENEDGTFAATATYTSPMADVYGIRHAKPIRDDRFTDNASLLDYIKSQIQDTPEISITIDFADMRKAGYPYDVPGFGDTVYLIYEPLDVDMTTRILEIIDYPESDKSPQVTLANFREQFADVVFRHTKNEIEKIYDPNSGKVKYSVLDDAVKVATEALQSAQTELEFNNGIIAREKTNPNKIVVYNSAGIGISTNGGSSFNTAVTADGIVADVITAGTLKGIYVEGVEIRGSTFLSEQNPTTYTKIENAFVESRGTHTRTFRGVTSTSDIKMRFENGYLRARNDSKEWSLYFSDFGISTYADGEGNNDASGSIIFRDQTYSDAYSIMMHSHYGVVAMRSEENRVILDSKLTANIESMEAGIYMRPFKTNRVGSNVFYYYVKMNDSSALTDGVLHYGSEDNGFGSGVRFSKDARYPIIYATDGNGDIGSGDFYARDFYGDLMTKVDNVYAKVSSAGEFRVTDQKGYNNGSPAYRDLAAKDVRANSIRLNMFDGASNFYIGTSTGEVRITNNLLYNGGDIGYKPIRASSYESASSIQYKTNIEDLSVSGLGVINNLEVKQYVLKEDVDNGIYNNWQVGLISEVSPEVASPDMKSINLYKLVGYLTKAVQEISVENEALKQRVTDLEMIAG